jgi:hypothetical protein
MPEQKLAHHTENTHYKDQSPSVRPRPEPYRADTEKLFGNAMPNGRIYEFPRMVNRLENTRRTEFSNREFVFSCLLGSRFKSFGFNAPRMVRKLEFLPFSAISGIERRLRMKAIRYRSVLPGSFRRRNRKT